MLATHMDAFVETFTEDSEKTAVVRWNKVCTARQRLAEGRYDRDELLDRVLEAILDDMAL